MKYHIITIVWGKEFTDLFASIVLPNLLSEGNLPAFGKEGAVFRIFSTPEYRTVIERSQAYKKLAGLMPVEFIDIGDMGRSAKKYDLISDCHKKAIDHALERSASLIFLPPDQIYSDGAFAEVKKMAEAGYKAMLVSSIRVEKEAVVPLLLRGHFSSSDDVISIKPRDLMRCAIENPHAIVRELVWGGLRLSHWPSHIYFPAKGEGMIARCFHLHPIYVDPKGTAADFSVTIDSDYLSGICSDPDRVFVVEDSDRFCAVELDSRSQKYDRRFSWLGSLGIAIFAKYHSDACHREFFRKKIYLHYKDVSSSWASSQRMSDTVVKRVFFWLKFEPFIFSPRIEAKKIVARIRGIFMRDGH